jgi:hypothetical protein
VLFSGGSYFKNEEINVNVMNKTCYSCGKETGKKRVLHRSIEDTKAFKICCPDCAVGLVMGSKKNASLIIPEKKGPVLSLREGDKGRDVQERETRYIVRYRREAVSAREILLEVLHRYNDSGNRIDVFLPRRPGTVIHPPVARKALQEHPQTEIHLPDRHDKVPVR